MHTKYQIKNNSVIITNEKGEVETREVTTHLKKILKKENKLEKMKEEKQKIEDLLASVPSLEELAIQKRKKIIGRTVLIALFGIALFFSINLYVQYEIFGIQNIFTWEGLRSILGEFERNALKGFNIFIGSVTTVLEGLNIAYSYFKYKEQKEKRMGILAKLHFLKEEIPKEEQALAELKKLDEPKKKKDSKEKRVYSKKVLYHLKKQLENWEYYGSEYAYYIKQIESGELTLEELQEMLKDKVDYNSYMKFLKEPKGPQLNLTKKKAK